MKITLATIILLFTACSAYAESFSIGGKDVVIPSPQGFSYVTEEMDAVYRLSLQMVDTENDQLAYYISDSDIPIAMAGEIPSLERTFLLKVNKQLKNMVVGTEDFAEFKDVTKRQSKDTFESIKSQMPGLMEETNEGISKEFDIDFAMQISQMIPLEPHYEVDNAISHSMYINYGITTEGTEEELIVSATATYVNVAGKVLFLYCYGPKDELEWTRSASKSWAERIMNSNTQPPAGSAGGRGIDWNRVIEKVIKKGIFGIISGGLIALIIGVLSIFKKEKKG
jgi:hypothetical protein